MIYFVEVTDHGRGSCWTAIDEDAAISAIAGTFSRCGDLPESDASFAEWVEYNGRDLRDYRVFMTDLDAKEGLGSDLWLTHSALVALQQAVDRFA
jgi:hypothetical protein